MMDFPEQKMSTGEFVFLAIFFVVVISLLTWLIVGWVLDEKEYAPLCEERGMEYIQSWGNYYECTEDVIQPNGAVVQKEWMFKKNVGER